MEPFSTINNLPFESGPYGKDPESHRFRVGTCHGLWRPTEKSYDIVVVVNDVPGNCHFHDVLQWFENSCMRDGKALRFLFLVNPEFKAHLMKKGFVEEGESNLIKYYKPQK